MMIADALSPSPTSFLALTLNSYVAPFSEIIRVNSEHSFFLKYITLTVTCYIFLPFYMQLSVNDLISLTGNFYGNKELTKYVI